MSAAATQLSTPRGDFDLRRYPARRRESLQAWCAADLLLLEGVCEQPIAAQHTLVVNDDFGALSLPLTPHSLWTDSCLSLLALRENEALNKASETPVIWSTKAPPADIQLVVMRVPKSLPYFEYQLANIARHLPEGATILAAGMDKHLSPQTASVMEKWLGPTTRHRGRQKARLFSATLHKAAVTAPARDFGGAYDCPELGATLYALPNVFSAGQLDIGSRFLLSELQALEPVDRVIDLACGNGVLGLAALQRGLGQQALFCDESAMAIASAQHNSAALLPEARDKVEFHLGDGLRECPWRNADLILCNPPFHLGHVVDDFAGRRLLAECTRYLAPSGSLCLVANRHLDYRPVLRSNFGEVDLLSSNTKFNIIVAKQPRH